MHRLSLWVTVLTGTDLSTFLRTMRENLPAAVVAEPEPEPAVMPTLRIYNPAANSTKDTSDVSVNWTVVNGQNIDEFEIQWDMYSTFSTPEGKFTAGSTAVGFLLEDLPERRIYARVRAKVGDEYSEWATVSFTVKLPEAPSVDGDCLPRETLDVILGMESPGDVFDAVYREDGYRFGRALDAGDTLAGNWVLHGAKPSNNAFGLDADVNLWLTTGYTSAPEGGWAVPLCAE